MEQLNQSEFRRKGKKYKNISSPETMGTQTQITNLVENNGVLKCSKDNGDTYNQIKVDYAVHSEDADSAVKFTNQTLTAEQQRQARTNIGAYTKPESGIPKSDLAGEVQESLEKANSALQSLPIASSSRIGGVQPETKDVSMTQTVGVDAEGRLFTQPPVIYLPKIYKTTQYLNTEIGGMFALDDVQIEPSSKNIKAKDLVYDPVGTIGMFISDYDSTGINSAKTLYVSGNYAADVGQFIEVGTDGQTEPSATLQIGGMFFMKEAD